MIENGCEGSFTHLYWYERGALQTKYDLQGVPGRRVIPQTCGEDIYICFSNECMFKFIWADVTLGNVHENRRLCALIAQVAGITVSDRPTPSQVETEIQPRTEMTPTVPLLYDAQPFRRIHRYKALGSGGFGTVYEAVDPATGRLWAVKVSKSDSPSQQEKVAFKNEVEILASLNHVGCPRPVTEP